jgi:hypothetical protein
LVHWNKIICPRLTVWTSHRINLSYIVPSTFNLDVPSFLVKITGLAYGH